MRSFKKTYVNAIVKCDKGGYLSPMLICWENNKTYKIEKVLRCTAGGKIVGKYGGLQYQCLVGGKEITLYFEDSAGGGRWFVEGK